MAVEVIFYSLAPKPPARGARAFEAVAVGKTSRGRKWYRLEATPETVYQFPDATGALAVEDWYFRNTPLDGSSWVAYSLGGEVFPLGNDDALARTPGGRAAVDNAVSCHRKGKPGWVVFIGGSGDE